MGYITLTDEVLRNFARVVGEIDWAADDATFLGQANSQSRYSSHMRRGAFIEFVRTAVGDGIRGTGSIPQGVSEDAFREYWDAERAVVRSGRPYVFDVEDFSD